MRRPKRVIRGFTAFGETAKPVFHTQRPNPVAAFGQYLVRVALMAHVPHQFITGCVEYRMQGHRQFDDPQTCTQMASCNRHR